MKDNVNLGDFVKLVVTGKTYRDNKRFSLTYSNDISGRLTAFGINLWNGSIWGVLPNGKRKLVKRVCN